MEEVRRVSTTSEKKKSTTLLIVIAAILGIGLIISAVYFYTLEEPEGEQTLTETTCACYYIDPKVVSECGDPRRGFSFELNTVPSNQNCSTPCSIDNLSTNLLNSTTKQDLYQICTLPVVQDSRCSEMTIKDSAGKIVTGKIPLDEKELTIEAKFDAVYTGHKFVINNQEVEPDSISPDSLTITKTYTELDTSTLNIFATASDASANQINSPICRRLIEVEQTTSASVSTMQVQTRKDEDTYKVSRIKIGIGNIKDDTPLTIRFSFGPEDSGVGDLSMTDGFTIDSTKGEISILEQDLYNSENFSTDLSFSQLDRKVGNIKITAEVRSDTEVIGTVDTSFNFPQMDPTSEELQEAEESKFRVSKTSNVKCIERVTPNNVVEFTLKTVNDSTTAQIIYSVKDKLPLGFTYVADSTKINGVKVDDTKFVTTTNIGDTQEVVWEKTEGWSVNSGQSLTIAFISEAGENALTGENQNEVVITPAEIPEDPETLRAELILNVAQSCTEEEAPVDDEETPVAEEPDSETTPETGIFDSVISRILLGMLVVTVGWYIYSRPMGQTMIEKLINSGAYKEAEVFSWKIFKPKKYFETKLVRKVSKNKKKKS
ncbi:MAG TPA: hypothetical protein P5311_00140 [Candidatus Dojkabacteria bacterium]|nr:hypothetical protein [Candidatus Dojkabacteria bacterium]